MEVWGKIWGFWENQDFLGKSGVFEKIWGFLTCSSCLGTAQLELSSPTFGGSCMGIFGENLWFFVKNMGAFCENTRAFWKTRIFWVKPVVFVTRPRCLTRGQLELSSLTFGSSCTGFSCGIRAFSV